MGLLNDILTLQMSFEGECIEVHDGVAFFLYSGDLKKWDEENPNTAAILRGENVLIRSMEDYTPQVIKHELKHAEQLRRYGNDFLYRVCYLFEMLRAKITTGDAYQNKFELEATAAEKE